MRILIDILVGILLFVGLVGSVVPILPGTLLIFAGALIYGFATHFDPLGPWRLAILAALTALAYVADYVAGAFGVKKWGGSRWAMLGAVLGALTGAFFAPIGLILGPIVGAVLAELVSGHKMDESLRSGVGSAVGMVFSAVARLSLALIMVGLFLWWIWID